MKIFIVIITLLLLPTACTWLTNKTKQNPPTNKNMICADIGRQLTFDRNDPNAPTRQSALLKEYRKYNCAEVVER